MYETLSQIRKFQAGILIAIGIVCILEFISYYCVIYAANTYHHLAKINQLTYEQKLEFQGASITSRRIMAELEVSPNGSRTIERAQQKLVGQIEQLVTTHTNLRAVFNEPQIASLISDSSRHTLIDDLIDKYVSRLEQLASLPAEKLSTNFRHWSELDIIASVDGTLMRSLDGVTSDMSSGAERASVFLEQVQVITNIGSVLVIAALAFLVVRPAVIQLRKSSESDLQLRKELQKQSLTDGLTGLKNRKAFEELAHSLTKQKARYLFAIVDLNAFKPINDTFGHAAGDCSLVEVAKRSLSLLRCGEKMFRIGGDEFVVISMALPGKDTPDADDLGKRLTGLFDQPISFNGRDIILTASIGVADSIDFDGDFNAVASAADQAMYSGKSRNQTVYRLYEESMGSHVVNLETKEQLLTSIRQRAIKPYYQPQYSLRDGQLIGMEALARWDVNIHGRSSASTFIEQIETHGLSTEFNISIIRQVLEQMSQWRQQGILDFDVSVNLDGSILSSQISTKELIDHLNQFPEELKFLKAEVTEDVLIARNMWAIRKSIEALKSLGIKISMDDFGTGYGSFRHLKEFQFDEWKIDRQFVWLIGEELSSEVMIEGFLAMAKSLSTTVIAEGVETEEQAQFLRKLGCDGVQGFLYSQAVNADSALDLIRKNRVIYPKDDNEQCSQKAGSL